MLTFQKSNSKRSLSLLYMGTDSILVVSARGGRPVKKMCPGMDISKLVRFSETVSQVVTYEMKSGLLLIAIFERLFNPHENGHLIEVGWPYLI